MALTILVYCGECDRLTRQTPVGRSVQCTECGSWSEHEPRGRRQGSLRNDYMLGSER